MVSSQSDRIRQAGEQRYRHLFEHMPICIFVADLTVTPAIILEVNRRAELVYGYTNAELMGMEATQLVPAEALPTVLSVVQRVQQGETVTAETINQHRDGTRFPVRIIAAPDPADAGLMIVTVEDITAEKARRSEAEAIDAERRRIAHEIHDGVAQSLAGLRFKSALWSHRAEAAPPGMRAALDELQVVLNTAIIDLRRAIFALRPVDLETLGFFPALAQLVGDFGDQNQLVARLELSDAQARPARDLRIAPLPPPPGRAEQHRPARPREFGAGAHDRGCVRQQSRSWCATTAVALTPASLDRPIVPAISVCARCASGSWTWAARWTSTAHSARARNWSSRCRRSPKEATHAVD